MDFDNLHQILRSLYEHDAAMSPHSGIICS